MVFERVSVERVGVFESSETHPTGLLHIWAAESVIRVLCDHVVAADPKVFEDLVAIRASPLANAVCRAPIPTFAEAPTWLTSSGANSLKLVHCSSELSHLVLISFVPQSTILRTQAIPLLLDTGLNLISRVIICFKLRLHVLCELIEGNTGP